MIYIRKTNMEEEMCRSGMKLGFEQSGQKRTSDIYNIKRQSSLTGGSTS